MNTEDEREGVQPHEMEASPLVGYYERRVPLKHCVAALQRDGAFAAPITAQQETLGRLEALDPDLEKSWRLAKSQVRRTAPARILVDWTHLVVTRGRHLEPDASVSSVISGLAQGCLPIKGNANKKSLNRWRLGIVDLRWQRGLTVEQVTSALSEHFTRASDRTDILDTAVFSTLLGSTKAQLKTEALIVAWMTRLAAGQASDLVEARRQLSALQDQRTSLQADVARLQAQSASLKEAVNEAERQARAAKDGLVECEDSATLRLHGLAGKAGGKLSGRIGPLLAQANEALAMTQPSVRAAREFVETARKESEELAQWLRAESTSERPTA